LKILQFHAIFPAIRRILANEIKRLRCSPYSHRGAESEETCADCAKAHLRRQLIPSLYRRHLIRGGNRSNQAGDSPYRGGADGGGPLLPERASPGCGACWGSGDIRPLGREGQDKEGTGLRCGKRIEPG
jgi:hypothetical protein